MDAEGFDEFIHPSCTDADEGAVGDDGAQSGLGSFPALEEPVGK